MPWWGWGLVALGFALGFLVGGAVAIGWVGKGMFG